MKIKPSQPSHKRSRKASSSTEIALLATFRQPLFTQTKVSLKFTDTSRYSPWLYWPLSWPAADMAIPSWEDRSSPLQSYQRSDGLRYYFHHFQTNKQKISACRERICNSSIYESGALEVSVRPQHTRWQSSSRTVPALPQAVITMKTCSKDFGLVLFELVHLWISKRYEELSTSSYFSSRKASSGRTALVLEACKGEVSLYRSQAEQHVTLCGHRGQYRVSWLRWSHGRWSHWLRRPSQRIWILKTFLYITRNARERANALNPRSLETRCYPINPTELDRNSGIIKPSCHRNRARFPVQRENYFLDSSLRNSHCRKSIITLLWLVTYLYFRVAGVKLTSRWAGKEWQHGLSHFSHPRNELCLCYVWILKEMFAVTLPLPLSPGFSDITETFIRIRLF